jgi:hypothetical protein
MNTPKYSPAEKALYFAEIRRMDPKALCTQKTREGLPCNAKAVAQEPVQACKYHHPGGYVPPAKNQNGERPRDVIDSLVLLLDEVVWKLQPAENAALIKTILARIKEVRPLGLPAKPQDVPNPIAIPLPPEEHELRRLVILAAATKSKRKKAMYWAAHKKLKKKMGGDK